MCCSRLFDLFFYKKKIKFDLQTFLKLLIEVSKEVTSEDFDQLFEQHKVFLSVMNNDTIIFLLPTKKGGLVGFCIHSGNLVLANGDDEKFIENFIKREQGRRAIKALQAICED